MSFHPPSHPPSSPPRSCFRSHSRSKSRPRPEINPFQSYWESLGRMVINPQPLEHAGGVMDRALCQSGLKDEAQCLKISRIWQQAVGDGIARHTAPQFFKKGVLVVKASNPTWQHELVFLKEDIVQKLNALLKKDVVHDLKLISGILPPPSCPAQPPEEPAAPLPAETLALVRHAAEPIADPEVRAAFESCMATHQRVREDLQRAAAHPLQKRASAPSHPRPASRSSKHGSHL